MKHICFLIFIGLFSTQLLALDQTELDTRRALLQDCQQHEQPLYYLPPNAPEWENPLPQSPTIAELNLRLTQENAELRKKLKQAEEMQQWVQKNAALRIRVKQEEQTLTPEQSLIFQLLQQIDSKVTVQQQNSEQLIEMINEQQIKLESIDTKQDDMSHQLEGFRKSLKKITATIDSNPSHPLHNSLNNFRFFVCLTSAASTAISVYGTITYGVCMIPVALAPPLWLPGMVALASGTVVFISTKWQI